MYVFVFSMVALLSLYLLLTSCIHHIFDYLLKLPSRPPSFSLFTFEYIFKNLLWLFVCECFKSILPFSSCLKLNNLEIAYKIFCNDFFLLFR